LSIVGSLTYTLGIKRVEPLPARSTAEVAA